MRSVFVKCKCDVCGQEAIAPSEFNPWHHLYEDNLPSGWRQFDKDEFPWVDISGDQCAECQSSFSKHMEYFFSRWRAHVMEKSAIFRFDFPPANDDSIGISDDREEG